MKVFFVCTCYAPNEIGGAERSVRLLAEGLVARGDEATVISIAPDGKEYSAVINGVHCHYVRVRNLYWPHTMGFAPPWWKKLLWHTIDAYNPMMGIVIGRLIDQEKPDVVHANNLQCFSVSVWRAAFRRGVPVVQTLRDYYLACPNSVMFRNGRNCSAQCAACRVLCIPRRLLSNIPKAVTSVSRRTLDRIEGGGLFRGVPVKLVIGSATEDRPDAGTAAIRQDRQPGETLRFGFLGRIEAVKGIELLLKAFSTLPKERTTLLVGGQSGPNFDLETLKRAYAADNIHFLGFVRPAEFYSMIDVLVVPSLWEDPLPRVALEAYAYGIPVIATQIGGLAEIVEDGRTGYLFPQGDCAALAGILERLTREGLPAARFFLDCRNRSRDFEFSAIFPQYYSVLRNALRTSS